MNCLNIRDRLHAYMDGELNPEVAAKVEAHLAKCPSCASELETWRKLTKRLNHLPPIVPPDMLAASTRQAFRMALKASTMADWWSGLSRNMRSAAWGVALAGLIIGVILGGSLSSLTSPETDTYLTSLTESERILP